MSLGLVARLVIAFMQLASILYVSRYSRGQFTAGENKAIADAQEKFADAIRRANEARSRVHTTISGGGVYTDPYDSDRH